MRGAPSRGLAAIAAVGLLALAGCVSAQPPTTQSATGGASNPGPDAVSRCDRLTTAGLAKQLGVEFAEPRVDPSSTDSLTTCQWTAADQTSLVLTTVATEEPALFYEQTRSNSMRTLGTVTDVDIKGAKQAYQLSSLGRTGMLVPGAFVEVSVLVPTAEPKDVTRVAQMAADRS